MPISYSGDDRWAPHPLLPCRMSPRRKDPAESAEVSGVDESIAVHVASPASGHLSCLHLEDGMRGPVAHLRHERGIVRAVDHAVAVAVAPPRNDQMKDGSPAHGGGGRRGHAFHLR